MVAVRVVVMGVSGCGKSTVGRELAHRLGAAFVDGDDLHAPAHVQRMAAGIALTDADRQGWLRRLADRLGEARAQGVGMVLACSALKRSYRDRLRAADPELRFVHLQGEPDLIEARLARRTGHYMPVTLLESQLQTLEPPGQDERAIVLDIEPGAKELADRAARLLQLEEGVA